MGAQPHPSQFARELPAPPASVIEASAGNSIEEKVEALYTQLPKEEQIPLSDEKICKTIELIKGRKRVDFNSPEYFFISDQPEIDEIYRKAKERRARMLPFVEAAITRQQSSRANAMRLPPEGSPELEALKAVNRRISLGESPEEIKTKLVAADEEHKRRAEIRDRIGKLMHAAVTTEETQLPN